jgi:hypothetical protein
MKDSASAQNTIVAFYQEYFRNRYLYFTIGKQWSKDYCISKEYVSVNILLMVANINYKPSI